MKLLKLICNLILINVLSVGLDADTQTSVFKSVYMVHQLTMCKKAKYLGVMLKSNKTFSLDLRLMKSKFYSSFNAIFHKVKGYELATLHLVTFYCRPCVRYRMCRFIICHSCALFA